MWGENGFWAWNSGPVSATGWPGGLAWHMEALFLDCKIKLEVLPTCGFGEPLGHAGVKQVLGTFFSLFTPF